jgi:hypothetical protein
MTAVSQTDGFSFRTVYYIGSGAKFIVCAFCPLIGTIFLAYMLGDPRQLKEALIAWRTSLVGGLVILAGLGLWVWMIVLMFWFPLSSFVFPSFVFPRLTEGILLATSVYDVRKGRRPMVEITIGGKKLRAHTNPALLQVLETIPRGSQVRITSGLKAFIVRIEAAC